MTVNIEIEADTKGFRPCEHCRDWPDGCPYCRGTEDQDYADEFIADIEAAYIRPYEATEATDGRE